MPDYGFGWPSRDREGIVRSVIATWRDGLINLTRSNRLLNFKPSRTGMIRLVRPSPEDVLARLARGGTYRFRSIQQKHANTDACSEPDNGAADTGLPVPPPATDKLDTDKAPEDLAAALRVLYRRSNQDYLDRGVWVLYLAFGSLTWTDEDRFRYTSPLLLVPVQLESAGAAQGRELKLAPEEPVVNPALALKLSQYGIDLPRVDDLEDDHPDRVLGRCAGRGRQPGPVAGQRQPGAVLFLLRQGGDVPGSARPRRPDRRPLPR